MTLPSETRVIVCGSRAWHHRPILDARLDRLADDLHRGSALIILHGGQKGADQMGKEWALRKGIGVMEFQADWHRFGKAAGPIRNEEMLKARPTLVLAFHEDLRESRGTRDMLQRATLAGVPWELFDETSLRPIQTSREPLIQ